MGPNQCDWCPYKKGEFRDGVTWRAPCEEGRARVRLLLDKEQQQLPQTAKSMRGLPQPTEGSSSVNTLICNPRNSESTYLCCPKPAIATLYIHIYSRLKCYMSWKALSKAWPAITESPHRGLSSTFLTGYKGAGI